MRSARDSAIPWKVVLLALAVGWLLRLVMLLLLRFTFDTGDAMTYQWLGRTLAAHGAYSASSQAPFAPTVLRAPLLPALFALTLKLFGDGYLALQITQGGLNLAACLLLYLALAKYSPRVALFALWLAVLSPFDAAFAGALWTESLCGSLLVAAMVAPLLFARTGWFVSGLALAAAALTKDVYLGLVVLVPLLLLLGLGPDPAGRRRAAAWFTLAALLLLTPWTVRNYFARGQFIPVSAGLLGVNVFNGTWERHYSTGLDPGFAQAAYRDFGDRAQAEAAGGIEDEHARDVAYTAVAWRRIRTRPLLVLRNWVERYWQMWLGNRLPFELRFAAKGTVAWWTAKVTCAALNVLFVALGIAGLVFAWRARSRLLAWLALPLVYTALVYFPVHNSEARYSQPVFLFVLAFAGLALAHLTDAGERERPEDRRASA